MKMLIQRPNDLYDYVLHKKQSRVDNIVNHIERFYGEYNKAKKDKLGHKRRNKEKYVQEFGEFWTRPINPPNDELKAIQVRINSYLQNNVPFPDFVYGGVPKKDNVKNAYEHKGRKYVFQTDLKDFFPFITNKMVNKALVGIGFSSDVASIITKLTTYKGHLPQGAPTSTTIANIVFLPTGRKLEQLAKENNLRFTIFVDDVTFSSHIDFNDLTTIIVDIIVGDGFKISRGKTTYKSGITEITGVKMLNNSLTVTEKIYKKMLNISNMKPNSAKGLLNYARRVHKLSKISKSRKSNQK